jgi:hypothetical protein
MAKQVELLEWKGVAKVSELSRQKQFSDAYMLNEHYINLWEEQDAETKMKIIHYWGVNERLLENNKIYFDTIMADR